MLKILLQSKYIIENENFSANKKYLLIFFKKKEVSQVI